MEAEGDPFNPVDDDGVAHLHLEQVSLSSAVVEVSVDGEVVEVAAREHGSSVPHLRKWSLIKLTVCPRTSPQLPSLAPAWPHRSSTPS